MMMSAYILFVHAIFKQLRNLFGKLMIVYSLSIVLRCLNIYVIQLTHFKITVSSSVICQIIWTSFMMIYMIMEGSATCILTHLAYVVYRSYKLRSEMSRNKSQYLFKCYMGYTFGSTIFFLVLIVSNDVVTGIGRFTQQPDGHCMFFDHSQYSTYWLTEVNTTINKFAQAAMFVGYLVYYYKLRKLLRGPVPSNRQQNKQLSAIAVVMGATIGYFGQ